MNAFSGIARRIAPDESAALAVDQISFIQRAAFNADMLLAANAFTQAWPRILPNVLALIRCLHSVWEPAVRDTLLQHPIAKYVYRLYKHYVVLYYLYETY
jgi:hypothetical protein